MNLKRRDSAASSPEEKNTPNRPDGKKPVLVYILILFIVALLLMFWSLLSHQRNNSEAIGALSDSVAAMQTAQSSQKELITLQKQLAEAQKNTETLERELQNLQAALEESQKKNQAYVSLFCLQQLYDRGDYAACQEEIQQMEANGYDVLLPISAGDDRYPDRPSPGRQYELLKETTEARLAEVDAP